MKPWSLYRNWDVAAVVLITSDAEQEYAIKILNENTNANRAVRHINITPSTVITPQFVHGNNQFLAAPGLLRTKLQSYLFLLVATLELGGKSKVLWMSDWFILYALVFLLIRSSNSKAANDLLDLQPAFQQPLPLSTTNTWGGENSTLLGNSSIHTATTCTHILISAHTPLLKILHSTHIQDDCLFIIKREDWGLQYDHSN